MEKKERGFDEFVGTGQFSPFQLQDVIKMTDFISVRPEGEYQGERSVPDPKKRDAQEKKYRDGRSAPLRIDLLHPGRQ
jgi:hypothetical protein